LTVVESGSRGWARRGGPGPGQEIVDAIDRVVGDSGENVAQIGLWVEAVEGRGLDQGVENGRATATAVRAGEEIVLSFMSTST
jgi:hypothetical protein